MLTAYIDNDNRVVVQVDNNGTAVTDATVTFIAQDLNGDTITGGTGSCTYDSTITQNGDTKGVYYGTLDDAFAASDGDEGFLQVTVTAGGLTAVIAPEVEYKVRR